MIIFGKSGGEKKHALTADENGPHSHDSTTGYGGGGAMVRNFFTSTIQFTGAINTGTSGLGTPHNNLQPYSVVNYIIKI